MRCGDGAVANFSFRRLTVWRGHGVGSFSRGEMSFVYGLSAAEATPYLKLPDGKKLTQNATELAIDYDMEKTATGWMVYDIKIADVSLVTTYRATFAAVVRERGVDGLIKLLSEKNRPARAALESRQMEGIRVLGVVVRAASAASAK